MSKTRHGTTPPEHLVEILQQTILNLANGGFTVAAGNSVANPGRLNISVDGVQRCGTCHDLALAATIIDGRCLRCRT